MSQTESIFIPRNQQGVEIINQAFPDILPSPDMAGDKDGMVDTLGDTSCECQESGWLITTGEAQKELAASVLTRLIELKKRAELGDKLEEPLPLDNSFVDNPFI